MLGLCCHEPHFSLLREEVKYGRKAKQRTTTPEETKFFLLHLSLMREYLELEFGVLKSTLPFQFDIEKIIDDWVSSVGSHKHGNEPSGSIKGGKFLD
jgi:5'-3' exoribonuclease 1